jgi:hypothetical protein
MKQRLTLAAYVLWVAFFAVGLVRARDAFRKLDGSIQRTQEITVQIEQESQRIQESTRVFRAKTRDAEFLQSLVNVMPQSKSFIRTQRAISDEVESLRYKVGRRIKNDRHILVDTRANKLYV